MYAIIHSAHTLHVHVCMYVCASLTHILKGIVANYTPACTESISVHTPTDDFLQVVINYIDVLEKFNENTCNHVCY